MSELKPYFRKMTLSQRFEMKHLKALENKHYYHIIIIKLLNWLALDFLLKSLKYIHFNYIKICTIQRDHSLTVLLYVNDCLGRK